MIQKPKVGGKGGDREREGENKKATIIIWDFIPKHSHSWDICLVWSHTYLHKRKYQCFIEMLSLFSSKSNRNKWSTFLVGFVMLHHVCHVTISYFTWSIVSALENVYWVIAVIVLPCDSRNPNNSFLLSIYFSSFCELLCLYFSSCSSSEEEKCLTVYTIGLTCWAIQMWGFLKKLWQMMTALQDRR